MPRKRTERPVRRSSPQPRPGYIAIGLIRSTRGVRGELSIEQLTDFPERFQPGAAVWVDAAPYTVRRARPHRAALLLELEEIETREQAERLRGLLLEVPEAALSSLEEHRYYRFQIVGLEVEDTDGISLGRVEEVLETGADDVYIVRNAEGDLLIPAIDTVVKLVDIAAGRMVVEPLAGLKRRPPTPPRQP